MSGAAGGGTRRLAVRWIALPLMCVAAAGIAATAATARTDARTILSLTTPSTPPFATGLGDPVFQTPQASTAFAMARSAGATYAKLLVPWNSIAPISLPSKGFTPTDPKSIYYHWSGLDANIVAANEHGVTPILNIVSPPKWAYSVKPGSWTGGSPNVTMLGQFATALAKHYNRLTAPFAHIFTVWNEPNYTKNLYPQSETYYLSMVNAVATSVHAVNPADLVGAGELAPVKNVAATQGKNHAIPPITFMQKMFCLTATTPVHRTCSTKADFDIWVHHPYSDTGPFGKAKISGGVELGDLPKMYALLGTAEKLGAISSAKPVQFWATEIGWDSNPPNSHGAPMNLDARWVSEADYQMWKSGVTLGAWFTLQDEAPWTAFQSGLYYGSASLLTAKAKPLLTPFKFPFVAYLHSGGKVYVWGRDTTSNLQTVTIQEQIGSKPFKTVATVTSNSYGIFEATLSLHAQSNDTLQAIAPGSGTSRPFSLMVPNNENLNVVPFTPN